MGGGGGGAVAWLAILHFNSKMAKILKQQE